jgi:deoxyadenosine/deoxycytidine kinase
MDKLTVFGELSEEQQEKIVAYFLTGQMELCLECSNYFSEELLEEFNKACKKMGEMQTPWFISQAIMGNEELKHHLTENAKIEAYSSMYRVMDGIVYLVEYTPIC